MPFRWIAAEYRKPVLLIASLNVVVVGLITVAWNASGGAAGLGIAPLEAEQSYSRCQAHSYRRGQISPVQLKARAARIFEKERAHRTVEYGFLVALSSALRFAQLERVEELLNEYECGRTL